ncbi:tryptophan-rich sensory protein [Rhodovastum atsumiense]|uniref:Tryptophan-rich sensory protein n=2 Tax=Rhodovastum atsumiense TaxID=504468 RepID=A0A5M6IZ74_9PROT|nr:tryptophan-rich sensory protein [Rhodovastum atsumiense]
MTDPNLSTWYDSLGKAPGTPPNWVFPVVWSSQYVLIGIAAWLVWRDSGISRALVPWFTQLFFNFLWSPAFFGLHSPGLGLVAILPLLASIVWTLRIFWRVRPLAGALIVPYLVWGCYAAYLNVGFFILNPG